MEQSVQIIDQTASRIADKGMRKATLKLAFQVVGADGLNENEAKLLFNFGLGYWNTTSEEIRVAVAQK